MVSVPVRAGPVFAATLKPTAPSPLPLLPEVMLIHEALLVVVHAQPLVVDTAMGPPVPAVAARDSLVRLIAYSHGAAAAAACSTVNVSPAMVSVPVRAAPVFAATLNPTDALPVPVAPDVIVIQGVVVCAVHEQVAPAETVMAPVPPAAAADCPRGAIAYVHGVAPACVTVNSRPAIVIVPERPPPLFAATRNATEPLPLPEFPDVTVIQGAVVLAVHSHPAALETVIDEPVPPATPMS